MGNTSSTWDLLNAVHTEEYYGSGCMFVGKRTILAGIQHKKSLSRLTSTVLNYPRLLLVDLVADP